MISCAAVVGFLVAMGLDMTEAVGTSLVVVGLTVPTLLTHVWIGDLDWVVSGVFAAGLVPAAFVGALLG